MATLILLYSRSSTLKGPVLAEAIRETATAPPYGFAWSLGGRAGAEDKARVGDRAFLYAQGNVSPSSDRYKLFASGHLVAISNRNVVLADGQSRRAADIDWDAILPLSLGVPREALDARVPGERWTGRPYGDVVASANSAAALNGVWTEHLHLLSTRART